MTISNYFSEDSPGKSLSASVEDEKMKLLRLTALMGKEGKQIYDTAQRRVAGSKAKAINDVGTVKVPESVIKEVAEQHEQALTVFDEAIAAQEQQAKRHNIRERSIEGLYKDAVAADQPLLEGRAQNAIDDYNAAQLGRGGSGGGSGSGSGSGPQFGNPTLPADYLESDPTRVAGYDPTYYADTGTAAPAPSAEGARNALANDSAPAGNKVTRNISLKDPAIKSTAGGGVYRQ